MMFDDLGREVDVRLAGAEVAALDGVVEEPHHAVAVVVVVLGGVDAALRGDAGARRGESWKENALHLVAELAEARGRGAGQPGADDDDLVRRLLAGLTSFVSNL